MREAVGVVLSLAGAALLGFGYLAGIEMEWEGIATNLFLSFVGGMGIGSGLWLVLRRP
jgi:hypothetical protein